MFQNIRKLKLRVAGRGYGAYVRRTAESIPNQQNHILFALSDTGQTLSTRSELNVPQLAKSNNVIDTHNANASLACPEWML